MHSDYLEKARKELSNSQLHHQAGFSGRARVCARRAAGITLLYYLELLENPIQSKSAYNVLRYAQTSTLFPPKIQDAARILTMRVDEDFNLPSNLDPILAAETIILWVTDSVSKMENDGNLEA
jgi:hypothetical protein